MASSLPTHTSEHCTIRSVTGFCAATVVLSMAAAAKASTLAGRNGCLRMVILIEEPARRPQLSSRDCSSTRRNAGCLRRNPGCVLRNRSCLGGLRPFAPAIAGGHPAQPTPVVIVSRTYLRAFAPESRQGACGE